MNNKMLKSVSYSFNLMDKVLTITFNGVAPCPTIEWVEKIKPALSSKIKHILEIHQDIEIINFQGDRYGKELFNLCRLELYDLIHDIRNKNYRLVEDNSMKILYVNDSIFAAKRTGECCVNGLTIESETAPLDTMFYIINDITKQEYSVSIVNGQLVIPSEFLTIGCEYSLYCIRPNGLPTNTIKIAIEDFIDGKYATASADYDDLLDGFGKLVVDYVETKKKVSSHVDGYEVI